MFLYHYGSQLTWNWCKLNMECFFSHAITNTIFTRVKCTFFSVKKALKMGCLLYSEYFALDSCLSLACAVIVNKFTKCVYTWPLVLIILLKRKTETIKKQRFQSTHKVPFLFKLTTNHRSSHFWLIIKTMATKTGSQTNKNLEFSKHDMVA